MFAPQYGVQTFRPEIAKVAEETVLNLKALENRIEVLRNDLAALCTVIGHHEAARIAATPASWLSVTQPYSAAGIAAQTAITPGMVSPVFGQLPQWPAVGPLGVPQGAGIPPYASPYGSLGSYGVPFSAPFSPFVGPLATPFSTFR